MNKVKAIGMLAGAILLTSGGMGQATIVGIDGITYTAFSANTNTMNAQFLIHIENINGVLDTRDGRFGVESFAFEGANLLSGLSGTSAFGVFTPGGLNSGGCNGSGNFFCFDGPTPPGPALPAESQLNILFNLSVTSGNFLTWLASDPHFKINWVGTENNYDLVSLGGTGIGVNPLCTNGPCEENPPGGTPIPGAVWLFGGGLGLVAMFSGRRKRKQKSVWETTTSA